MEIFLSVTTLRQLKANTPPPRDLRGGRPSPSPCRPPVYPVFPRDHQHITRRAEASSWRVPGEPNAFFFPLFFFHPFLYFYTLFHVLRAAGLRPALPREDDVSPAWASLLPPPPPPPPPEPPERGPAELSRPAREALFPGRGPPLSRPWVLFLTFFSVCGGSRARARGALAARARGSLPG